MTELQKMYQEARNGTDRAGTAPTPTTSMGAALQGAGVGVRNGQRGHHAALRYMARKTGLDEGTIDRSLKRAHRADVLDGKRAKAEASA